VPATTLASAPTSRRDGAVRVSPHFYNDESDMERFGAGLRVVGAR
jgi:selenocysteine lyase/cysteine desulfurase